MNEEYYTADEIAEILHYDAQTLRNQVKSDIAKGPTGPNGTNFNAFQVGNALRFPKKWIDRKRGIGPVFELAEKIAEWLVAHGWAVNAEVQDDQ